jgi:hypothetical protein
MQDPPLRTRGLTRKDIGGNKIGEKIVKKVVTRSDWAW